MNNNTRSSFSLFRHSYLNKRLLQTLIIYAIFIINSLAVEEDMIELGCLTFKDVRYYFNISKTQIATEPKWNPEDLKEELNSSISINEAVCQARKLLASLGVTDAKERTIELIVLRPVPETESQVWFYDIRFEHPQEIQFGGGGRGSGARIWDQVPVLMSGRPLVVKKQSLQLPREKDASH